MDFEAWRCKHEKPGENLFCPEEGCTKEAGCARERGWLPPESSMPNAQVIASSECPVCGLDRPHAHTRRSLAAKYREEWLHDQFEKKLIAWFSQYGRHLPQSYGMGIHLHRKDAFGKYAWWPVEMVWTYFRAGVALFEPPWPDDSVPDVNEALAIKKNPFGERRGRGLG